ncbi:MAG TPA: ABC transporter substrate-binding protein [Longimicrobiaceae bacterium]|nr:ABC transporter substrate-binding protein [Longimicrobiaceae bacterium]
MRIISFLSSATEIVFELNLERHLVGISHECDYPPAALELPRVSRPRFDPAGLSSGEVDAAVRRCMEEYGSVYEVDTARVRELRPDLVLTQAVCEVCAVPTGSVAEAVGDMERPPAVLSLDAHTLDGILGTVQQVADAADASAAGAAAVSRLRARSDAVREKVAGRARPRTLMLEWVDPPFVPGHWVPEMVDIAGGENLLGSAGERSIQVGWDALTGLDPDCLLLGQCGYDLAQAREDADSHRARLRSIAGTTIESGAAWLLHSAYFSRSGPRVFDGVEVLGHILHPEAVDAPLAGRAEAWT